MLVPRRRGGTPLGRRVRLAWQSGWPGLADWKGKQTVERASQPVVRSLAARLGAGGLSAKTRAAAAVEAEAMG